MAGALVSIVMANAPGRIRSYSLGKDNILNYLVKEKLRKSNNPKEDFSLQVCVWKEK